MSDVHADLKKNPTSNLQPHPGNQAQALLQWLARHFDWGIIYTDHSTGEIALKLKPKPQQAPTQTTLQLWEVATPPTRRQGLLAIALVREVAERPGWAKRWASLGLTATYVSEMLASPRASVSRTMVWLADIGAVTRRSHTKWCWALGDADTIKLLDHLNDWARGQAPVVRRKV